RGIIIPNIEFPGNATLLELIKDSGNITKSTFRNAVKFSAGFSTHPKHAVCNTTRMSRAKIIIEQNKFICQIPIVRDILFTKMTHRQSTILVQVIQGIYKAIHFPILKLFSKDD